MVLPTSQVVLDLNRLRFYQERRRKYVSGILKPCLFGGYQCSQLAQGKLIRDTAFIREPTKLKTYSFQVKAVLYNVVSGQDMSTHPLSKIDRGCIIAAEFHGVKIEALLLGPPSSCDYE